MRKTSTKIYSIKCRWSNTLYDYTWTENCSYLSKADFKRSYSNTHKRELNHVSEDDILVISMNVLYNAFFPNGRIPNKCINASCGTIKRGQRPPFSDEVVERRDKVLSISDKIKLISNTLERALGNITCIDFKSLESFNASVDMFYKEAERRLKTFDDPEIDAHDLSDLNEMLAIFASRYVAAKFDQDYTTWFVK